MRGKNSKAIKKQVAKQIKKELDEIRTQTTIDFLQYIRELNFFKRVSFAFKIIFKTSLGGKK